MRIPSDLQPLIEDGIIDAVVRPLKSGKEAAVYVVRAGTELRCAKVYKDMAQRSFQHRAQYQEGRRARGSRESRAMSRSTRYGRLQAEAAWKNAEVDALYRLSDAGVRVPRPYGYYNGVLVMELIAGADGAPAPWLGEVALDPGQARQCHRFLVGQVVRMLCIGLIHGDLSPYNVLMSAHGPVIIDLPQVVDAAGNNNALAMLRRDVGNLTGCLGHCAPELLATRHADEMWALYQLGELRPDSELTGEFAFDDAPADVESVIAAIDDARQEAARRQHGRDLAAAADHEVTLIG
ncbi:MAG TPA: PA4780 family RIO1-like protein kinase [Xanthomonadaceae bacterium]|nr:PA4780 family RIO1-like protein kinase [Xanthomonadaceae bacterium]